MKMPASWSQRFIEHVHCALSLTAVLYSMLALSPALSPAQGCVEYRDYIHWVGPVPGGGTVAAGDLEHAYVVGADSILNVVDVREPLAARLVASLRLRAPGRRIALANERLCIAEGSAGVELVDVSDPTMPRVVWYVVPPGEALDIAMDRHAYVVCGPIGGLQVLDVASPGAPILVGNVDTPGDASSLAVAGTHAYVGDGAAGGLQVIDIGDPTLPAIIGHLPGNGWERVIGANDSLVGFGESLVDVSHPAAPVIVTHMEPWIEAMAMVGRYWYGADSGLLTLAVFDVSNPAAPRKVGSCSVPQVVHGVSVTEPMLFVNGSSPLSPGPDGLQMIQTASPTSPTRLGQIDMPGFISAIAISGQHAFVCDGDLEIVEVSNPTAPRLVATQHTRGRAYSIALSGTYAFVGESDSSVQVFDVSDPTAPSAVARVAAPGGARHVAVGDGLACIAGWGPSIQVLDVSNPAVPRSGFEILRAAGTLSPQEADYRALRYGARLPGNGPGEYLDRDVQPGEIYAYRIVGRLAAGAGSVAAGPVFATARSFLQANLTAAPNPTSGVTRLRLDLPRRGPVRVDVYDAAGHFVRKILDGLLPGGRHDLLWDGRDSQQRRIANGVYIVRLTGQRVSSTRLLTVVR
jgi:hypothetical protein